MSFVTYDLGDMTQITTRLYLGTIENARNFHVDNPKGITHVLNCTDDLALDHLERKSKITVLRLDQLDGHEYPIGKVFKALGFISRAMVAVPGSKVLVCCHAGISRSPSIVAGFLYASGMKWEEALRYVKDKRPIVLPHPKIELSIRRAFGLAPRSGDDLLQKI